jgi:hypothetical protein
VIVEVAGSLAYVGGSSLCIIDISNPTTPVQIGLAAAPDPGEVVAVSGAAWLAGYVPGSRTWCCARRISTATWKRSCSE